MAQRGVSGVAAEVADAQRDLARRKRRWSDPPAKQARGTPPTKAGKWTPNALGLPTEDPSPVQPLGIQGKTYYLIDSAGQYTEMAAADFSHSGIQSLFKAAPNYPEWAWPRYGRAPKAEPGEPPPEPVIKSFEDDACRKALFFACQQMGLFSPEDAMRGRGAWRLTNGDILYHAGESLWLHPGRLQERDCGLVDGVLYPRFAAIPAPWPAKKPIGPDDNPAGRLLADFSSWTWERPQVDPVLLLGWLGVALIGGALDWRSAVCLIGDRETGKSTLQHLIKAILGRAVVSTAETTKAGIYQLMKFDSRAVAIDELEASADNRKAMGVVELMRVASSGGLGLRGGQDGVGSEFQVRCAFLFSAINPPPMMPQDLSRIAKLRLMPRDKTKSGDVPPTGDGTTGRVLLTRLLAEWHRWPATFSAYRAALRAGGHSGRGQDTYGTLLAMADLLLGAELGEKYAIGGEDLSAWSTLLAAEAVSEVSDSLPNWQNCVLHLLTSRVQAWRHGTRATVGKLLEDLERGAVGFGPPDDENHMSHGQAALLLGQAGLGLISPDDPRWRGRLKGWGLAVPNSAPLVAEMFQGTIFEGAPGAPGWAEALRGGTSTGAIITDKAVNRVSVNGVQLRCTIVDLARFNELLKA